MSRPKHALEISDATRAFESIDREIAKSGNPLSVVVLGGVAVIAQGFAKRSTRDIDIAPTCDAEAFVSACNRIGLEADIITIASTVDLAHAPTKNIYAGAYLRVDAITARDLVKLKLERYYKQDPGDISGIIDGAQIEYEDFKALVREMVADYIGNSRSLILSAREVVERKFSGSVVDFDREIGI